MESLRPSLAQISLLASHPDVYEPSDDSFAIVDAISAHLEHSTQEPLICVEVGSGGGYVICSVALLLRQRGFRCHCIAVDVNPQALAVTRHTLRAHSVEGVQLVCCDLLTPFLPNLDGKVDLLISNPPYVPTPEAEVSQKGIAQAWAGGNAGRAVIDRLLPQAPKLLSEIGLLFLVTVAENDPEGICELLRSHGLSRACITLRRQADEETLNIIKAEA